jgi:hypothetical protein
MEGVCNILLLGFQPTIIKNKKEITNKCIFFLTNSKRERERERERSNPSSPRIYHSRASEESSKRCALLNHIQSPRENTKEHFHKREIPKIPKRVQISAN